MEKIPSRCSFPPSLELLGWGCQFVDLLGRAMVRAKHKLWQKAPTQLRRRTLPPPWSELSLGIPEAPKKNKRAYRFFVIYPLPLKILLFEPVFERFAKQSTKGKHSLHSRLSTGIHFCFLYCSGRSIWDVPRGWSTSTNE